MSKPRWLSDIERDAKKVERKCDLCSECAYFGKPVKLTRHRGTEVVEVHECDIHDKCLNTMYSICCDDWTPANLV